MNSEIFLACLVLFTLNIGNGNSEPHFTQEPKDFTGFGDKFGRFSSPVEDAKNPAYQWYHNGSELAPPNAFGVKTSNVFIANTNLASQGIYQLFVSSEMGKIFGREIKVEFIVVGKFFNKTKKSRNVVIGEQFQIECPAHSFTKHAVYKWGGTGDVTGTWFFNSRPNVLVLGDGRLFFSHVTKNDVDFIGHKGGISCILEATYEGNFKFEQSNVFEFNVIGKETKSFGPKLEKIADEEVVEGESLLLGCIAAGYPTPTYTWEKTDRKGVTTTVYDKVNGVVLADYNKVLVIKNVMKKHHAGTYTCHATIKEAGTEKTVKESSKVTIREKPSWVEGTLIKSATPNIYSEHSWICMAKGDPEPEYHWYANATIMMNTSGRHTIEGGILTFHRVSPEDNGLYQCVAKNKFGFEYQTVSLKVQVKAPKITAALSQQNFVAGNTGNISCVSDALPPATHHWLFNGVKLEPNKTVKYELTDTQDLVIHDLTQNDTGMYTCIAMNMFGKARQEKNIKVAEIMFKRSPENNTNVIEGTKFQLFCEAESDPPLNIRYRWLFQDRELHLSDVNHIWDVSTHTLTVSNAQGHESGIYECIAYSDTSKKSLTATVIVRALPDPAENLTLHGTCADLSANLTWTFSYRSSYEPTTRILIQWSTSRDSDTWHNFSDHVQGSANGHVVRGLNPYSDIVFRVRAENMHGLGKPSDVTTGQECKTPAAKPKECPANVEGNSSHPHDIVVTWQEVEALSQNGPGFGYVVRYRRPDSTWKNKTILAGNERRFTILHTAANELWEFQVLSYNDEGTGPECPISKARSAMEAEIMFRVRPENKTNAVKGGNFTLFCEAYSNPTLPIFYKWFYQGQNIRKSEVPHIWIVPTNTLTVHDLRFQDSGTYECVAQVQSSIYNVEKRSASIVIVRGVPDAPRNLRLGGECSNLSANLTWTVSHTYEPLTSFLIQWSTSRDNSTWYDVHDHVRGSTNGHVVQGLNPYSDIVFRVIAVNVHGQSEPSGATSGQECNTPPASPTKCAEDVEGSAKQLHTIEITWKEVPQLDQNGPEFGYNVSYRKPGSQWQHEVIQGAQRYTISNAGVDQLWEFKVRSKNLQGNGPECEPKQARTKNEEPKSAPRFLRSKEIGADYVILEWETLDASGVKGYKLSYWDNSITKTRVRRAKNVCVEKNPCFSRIENATTREYKQESLLPYKNYTMHLQAYNDEGLGPTSSPLTLTTKEGRPGSPEHMGITSYGRYLNVTWRPPSETNGIITGYVLGIDGENVTGENVTVEGHAMAYLFQGLEPVQDYTVKIQARTSAGVGNPESMVATTTKMRVPAVSNPPYVRGMNEDSVNVTYNPSKQTGGFSEKFYVVYKEKGQRDKELKVTNATWIRRDGEKSYIVVDGLDNTKRYMFATVVMNGNLKNDRSKFTEGHPILTEAEVSEDTPIYRQFWFYIILGIILLLLLILLLILLIRRRPKRVYKVSEREKRHAVNGSIEMGEEHPFKNAEFTEEPPPQGKTYNPIEAAKSDIPEVATSPPTSNGPTFSGGHSRDSLEEYDGEDDDFSEHGSFIGQYGNGEKPGASQSSPPSYV